MAFARVALAGEVASRTSLRKLARRVGRALRTACTAATTGTNTNTFGSAGSIEYAVEDLKVKVVVVMSHQGCGAVKAAYLKDQVFSPSLTHLVTDIRNGLTNAGICVSDESCYPDACIQHSAITARSLMEQSKVIHDSVKEGALLLQPAFLHIDPLSITWLDPFYGVN